MSENERFSFAIPIDSHFEELPDGGLLVHDVPIMCEGTWVGMENRRTTFTAEVLRSRALNWKDNLVWNRHQLLPWENRPASDSIGAVLNPRFESDYRTVLQDGTVFQGAAVLGDVLLHRKTDASRDAAVLIRLPQDQGGFRMVSAELSNAKTRWDASTQSFIMESFDFDGLTIQRRGGCKACNIPAYSSPGGIEMGNDGKVTASSASNASVTATSTAETVWTASTPSAQYAEGAPPEAPAPPAPGGGADDPMSILKSCHQMLQELLSLEKGEQGMGEGDKSEGGKEDENDGKERMSEPEAPKVDFSEWERKVAERDEEIRKLKAIIDKANSRPGETITGGPVNFSEAPGNKNVSARLEMSGHNASLRGKRF